MIGKDFSELSVSFIGPSLGASLSGVNNRNMPSIEIPSKSHQPPEAKKQCTHMHVDGTDAMGTIFTSSAID